MSRSGSVAQYSSASHCEVGLIVGDASHVAVAEHRGEKDLGIDAVLVLLLEPLLGRAGPGGVLVRESEGRSLAVRHPADIRPDIVDRTAFDDPDVASLRPPDDSRSAVPVLLGHTVGPSLKGHFEV